MSRIGKQRLCMVSRNHEIRQLVSKERTGYQQRQSNQPCRATTHCSAVPVQIATSHHMHVITGWQQSPWPSPAMVTSRESSRRAQHNPKGRSQPCSPCVDCDKLRSAVVQCHTVELLEARHQVGQLLGRPGGAVRQSAARCCECLAHPSVRNGCTATIAGTILC